MLQNSNVSGVPPCKVTGNWVGYKHLHWWTRRGCRVCKRTPKSFDLVKIREKFLKIRVITMEIWVKCVKTFAKLLYVLWFYKNGTHNQDAHVFVFLEVMFLWEIWASLVELWAKMVLEVLWFEKLRQHFFEGIFLGVFFGQVCSPQNLPAPTPMKTLSTLVPFARTYLCESRFSSLLDFKEQYRNRLNPSNNLRVALGDCLHRYERIITEKQQKSH